MVQPQLVTNLMGDDRLSTNLSVTVGAYHPLVINTIEDNVTINGSTAVRRIKVTPIAEALPSSLGNRLVVAPHQGVYLVSSLKSSSVSPIAETEVMHEGSRQAS